MLLLSRNGVFDVGTIAALGCRYLMDQMQYIFFVHIWPFVTEKRTALHQNIKTAFSQNRRIGQLFTGKTNIRTVLLKDDRILEIVDRFVNLNE